MDTDYSGRPLEPLAEAAKKPFQLDSLAVTVTPTGAEVVQIGDQWFEALYDSIGTRPVDPHTGKPLTPSEDG